MASAGDPMTPMDVHIVRQTVSRTAKRTQRPATTGRRVLPPELCPLPTYRSEKGRIRWHGSR
jgi:hypothetical protein